MKNKKIKNIVDIVLYILVFYLLSLSIAKCVLIAYEKTQSIYCNYAVETGLYEDDTIGRLNCAVDYLEKFTEDERK